MAAPDGEEGDSIVEQTHLRTEDLPAELRELVKISVSILGEVLQQSLGNKLFQKIESIRQVMAELRDQDTPQTTARLRSVFAELEKMSKADRHLVARSFTLMLELTNVCENAYRSHRLNVHAREKKTTPLSSSKPNALIYVLTAHPTEARAPENIAVFHLVQRQLIGLLEHKVSNQELESQLRHLLTLALKAPIVRRHAPSVNDEAEHIYSTLLEKNVLDSLLAASHEIVPVYIRTWVGGDKDGHPGVDEKVMLKSLSQSRVHLIHYMRLKLGEVISTLENLDLKSTRTELSTLSKTLSKFHFVKDGDGFKIKKLRLQIAKVIEKYKKEFGFPHPALRQIQRLLHVFPALVVPLELRESSDILLSDRSRTSKLAIDRMLRSLARISKGGSARWYARGLIISMASAFEHLQVADQKVRFAFGSSQLPVIPLFEQASALEKAPAIVKEWLDDPKLGRDVRESWDGFCEMMVGYSDSSKESGVLASRLEIAEAMHHLEKLCRDEKVEPLFFQGSGGSIDRGGGTIQDQIAWWPHSALMNYKVTIQGEMVERSFASSEITRGQIERIAQSAGEALGKTIRPPHTTVIKEFAASVATAYKKMVHDPVFLECAEKATPYSNINELHIGSRPSRRSQRLSVEGLRAIPWVLCWTQTRVLFPTWWGVGSSWKNLDQVSREKLRHAFSEEPVFASYIRALGFTLGKVELSVWRMYLEQSGLNQKVMDQIFKQFEQEFLAALEMLQFISGEQNPLWFNPRLAASIRLRSSMIHPLNLLQILAIQARDPLLLRLTVTGISSGMLTTG